jgi:exonuclease SbcD
LSDPPPNVSLVRILHTSDWHLGRSFHREGLLDAQAAFVDHLVETVDSEEVDLVVVSGDVYDRALPPVDAVELADETFARLAASRASVVVTSGNHDSQIRLGFNARLADAAGVHLRTRWQDVGRPVVLEDRHGPVAVHGLPYLEPDAVRGPWELPARTHEAALTEAMRRVRADLDERPGTRSVVMAHAFVAGSPEVAEEMSSDSERDISVGGVQVAPTRLFTDVDYAALGHLHGRAALTETVRYSGSPLAYSFSEARHRKGSWLVELGPEGVERTDFVPAPVPRRLATLRGRLEDLLADPTHAAVEDAWLQVTLTDADRPRQAMERLRGRFPNTLVLAFEPDGGGRRRGPVAPRVDGRSDLDVALGFVSEVRSLEATTEEALLLRLACDSCRINENADHPVTVEEAG